MTIADKLTLLEQTKEAQRVKLGLPKSIPFSDYKYFMKPEYNVDYVFKNGEQGVWLDPSDLKTMFQDVNGTEPVTRDGDPVALIKDKSGNNNHATQSVATSRPIYRTDGKLHWLEFDGTDDGLVIDSGILNLKNDFFVSMSARLTYARFNRFFVIDTVAGDNISLVGADVSSQYIHVINNRSFKISKVISDTQKAVFTLANGSYKVNSIEQSNYNISSIIGGGTAGKTTIAHVQATLTRNTKMSLYGLIASQTGVSSAMSESLLAIKAGLTL